MTTTTAERQTRPDAAGNKRPPLRVLVADDHPVYREGIVQALVESGRYQLAGEAADGRSALRLIVDTQPDVALLDLRMPGLDALGILRRLSRDGVHIPTLVLSAFDQPEIIEEALALGATGYVTKDAPRDAILFALDAAALRGRLGGHRPAPTPRGLSD